MSDAFGKNLANPLSTHWGIGLKGTLPKMASSNEPQLSIAVVIATRSRASLVKQLMPFWLEQSIRIQKIILSVTSPADLEGITPTDVIQIVEGPPGLCAQRNRALDLCAGLGCDLVAFFDDDFIPTPDTVRGVATFFLNHKHCAVVTGELIADGAHLRRPLTVEEGVCLVEAYPGNPETISEKPTTGGYGCNMAFRFQSATTVRFDERLCLYGWLEDIDYSVRFSAAANGAIIVTNAFTGVHLAVRAARTSGRKLGYSQVINPLYLIRKGSMPLGFGLHVLVRAVLANLVGVITADDHVDRIGRLEGNMLAIEYLIKGQLRPELIESL